MRAIVQRSYIKRHFAIWASAGLVVAAQTALAQSADRERAQMMQMQQQLQRLQADNAALQVQAKDVENLKKQSAQTSKDLVKARGEAAAANRDIVALRAELDALREQTNAQIEQWKKAVEERDTALQNAAAEKRQLDTQVALLSGRLKTQTGRADLCEVKHEQALHFGKDVVEEYEANRLRLCEPVTGIWKVREEGHIQSLRERLYELRLDVPSAQTAIPERASASSTQTTASPAR